MSDRDYSTADEVACAVRKGKIKAGIGLFGRRFYAYEPGLSTASAARRAQCERAGCLGDNRGGHFVCRSHGTDHGRWTG
jgi:hypothetical protein